MFCSNCGKELNNNANFCSYCGTALNQASMQTVQTMPVQTTLANSGSGDHRLVLVDTNNTNDSVVANLLEDLLNYSYEDADQLVDLAPIEIADNLSLVQARTLAQAFNEYGCDVTVLDEHGNGVDVSKKATSSIFDSNGNLLMTAATVLAGLTVLNKVTSYRRYKKPSLLEMIFRPKYRVQPPKPRRYQPRMPMPHHVSPRPIMRQPQTRRVHGPSMSRSPVGRGPGPRRHR